MQPMSRAIRPATDATMEMDKLSVISMWTSRSRRAASSSCTTHYCWPTGASGVSRRKGSEPPLIERSVVSPTFIDRRSPVSNISCRPRCLYYYKLVLYATECLQNITLVLGWLAG